MADKLKGEICKDSVLKNPDFNRKFILQFDASQIGMGAVLQQEFEDTLIPRNQRNIYSVLPSVLRLLSS
jgi:hypothetical protein